jgi:hypothetical protein
VLAEDGGRLAVLVGWPLDGGRVATARSLLRLHRAIEAGAWPGPRLDGPYLGLVISPGGACATVFTDLAGFTPAFHAAGAFGSHARAVAAVCGNEPDPVSAADFLAHGTITYPYTFFRGVHTLSPASLHRFVEGRPPGERTYWRPEEDFGRFATPRAAAGAIREGASAFVRGVAADVDEMGLLLSAGEDSRAVLGMMEGARPVVCVHFADQGPEGRETRLARLVAKAYGARFEVAYRTPTAYLDHLGRMTALVDAQQSYMEGHAVPLAGSSSLSRLPVVLTGHLADRMLKPLIGKVGVVAQPLGLRREIEEEMRARRAQHLADTLRLRPESGRQWVWRWPSPQGGSTGFRQSNRRLFRVAEPFMSDAVVLAASCLPEDWKEERRVFHEAMRPFLARAWYIPHGDPRMPYFGPGANRVLTPTLLAVRKVSRLLRRPEPDVNDTAWPSFDRLVASEAMMRSRASHLDSPALDLLADPRRLPATWGALKHLRWLQLVQTWRPEVVLIPA